MNLSSDDLRTIFWTVVAVAVVIYIICRIADDNMPGPNAY